MAHVRHRRLGIELYCGQAPNCGEYQANLALVRDELSLALGRSLVGPAAEVHQRLGDTLEYAGPYAQARETYLAAADFCQTRKQSVLSQGCLACMAIHGRGRSSRPHPWMATLPASRVISVPSNREWVWGMPGFAVATCSTPEEWRKAPKGLHRVRLQGPESH